MLILRRALTFLILLASLPATAQVPLQPNYTDVRAVVVRVDRLTFPHSRLVLSVTNSARRNVFDARTPTVITAETYFWETRGRIDCTDRRNIGAVAGYYLLQGDTIRAKMFTGSGRQSVWYIYGIERLPVGRNVGPGVVTSTYESLLLELEVPTATVKSGERVPLVLSVTNKGNETRVLEFSSGQQFDFIVTQAGRTIWQWSNGRVFTQALTSIALRPGDTRTFRVLWQQTTNDGRRVGTGSYEVTAMLTARGLLRSTVGPAPLVIQN